MKTYEFWPLDFDPEDEIYENPTWDLPGFRRDQRVSTRSRGEPVRLRNPYIPGAPPRRRSR